MGTRLRGSHVLRSLEFGGAASELEDEEADEIEEKEEEIVIVEPVFPRNSRRRVGEGSDARPTWYPKDPMKTYLPEKHGSPTPPRPLLIFSSSALAPRLPLPPARLAK